MKCQHVGLFSFIIVALSAREKMGNNLVCQLQEGRAWSSLAPQAREHATDECRSSGLQFRARSQEHIGAYNIFTGRFTYFKGSFGGWQRERNCSSFSSFNRWPRRSALGQTKARSFIWISHFSGRGPNTRAMLFCFSQVQ